MSGHSMFDWPEHIQTSPTRIFLNERVLLPVMLSVKGPPALSGPIIVCQCPLLSVRADALLPAISTDTCSFGLAQPQIRIFLPCCNTMLSPMSDGTRTSAEAVANRVKVINVAIRRASSCFLFIWKRFGYEMGSVLHVRRTLVCRSSSAKCPVASTHSAFHHRQTKVRQTSSDAPATSRWF